MSKKIRVALSGSGFKFPAHVGALLAIRDAGYTPIEYAGTSGGSIVATLAACGMSLDDMKVLTMTNDWSDMLSFNPWSLMTKMGFCSGSNLQDWLKEKTGDRTFAQLDTDLTIIASNAANEMPYVFNKKVTPGAKVALASRASAAIPFVYTPIIIDDAYLVDGGCANNIPVDRLTYDNVPCVGIQLVAKGSPMRSGIHTVFDIAPRIIDLMMSANENAHVDLALKLGAKVVFVETGYASGLDRDMSAAIRTRLLQDGYSATREAIACFSKPSEEGAIAA